MTSTLGAGGVRVHSTAIVHPSAELACDVEVGAYCVVGSRVRIHAGTRLLTHVVVGGRTTIGEGNTLHPFVVMGGEPQLRSPELLKRDPKGDGPAAPIEAVLLIGDGNVFREAVTVNGSSGVSPTSIGAHNLFMAGAHVAHDVVVGSNCVVANAVQLAGHVIVEDWVTFGGLSGVAQHLRVGQSAFVAAGAMCERSVPPFVIVQGDRARVRALNVIGLERRGVSPSSIQALKTAFRQVFLRRKADQSFDQAVRGLNVADPLVAELARALTACSLAG